MCVSASSGKATTAASRHRQARQQSASTTVAANAATAGAAYARRRSPPSIRGSRFAASIGGNSVGVCIGTGQRGASCCAHSSSAPSRRIGAMGDNGNAAYRGDRAHSRFAVAVTAAAATRKTLVGGNGRRGASKTSKRKLEMKKYQCMKGKRINEEMKNENGPLAASSMANIFWRNGNGERNNRKQLASVSLSKSGVAEISSRRINEISMKKIYLSREIAIMAAKIMINGENRKLK